PSAEAEKIAALVRLLGSNHDFEALGAARGLRRILGSTGICDLGNLVERHWDEPPIIKPAPFWNPPRRPEWQIRAERLLGQSEILFPEYPDEFDFLMNVSRMRPAPSAGQQKWMRDIEDAIARGINIEHRRRERAYARTA